MARRIEFGKKVKAQRFLHCAGRCETCGDKLVAGHDFDHDLAAALGGQATFENCRVLCIDCHYVKTHGKGGDRTRINKANRVGKKHRGEKPAKGNMPGSRNSRWKKKLNGKVERR